MERKINRIPVLLLTGYLGSGKTTLLNRILNNSKGIRYAVIVNDIGEVNIDADLIEKGGVVSQGDSNLVPLQNGCICCTLQSDLMAQVDELIKSGRFNRIVIEASGICEPEPIAQTLVSMESMGIMQGQSQGGNREITVPHLRCICTVVDALRMRDEFEWGESLSKEDVGEEDIESLVIQQIEFCNLILLNKISEISKEDARRVLAMVRTLQPRAEIVECDYCNVDIEELIDKDRFDFEDTATSARWIHEIEKGEHKESEAGESHGDEQDEPEGYKQSDVHDHEYEHEHSDEHESCHHHHHHHHHDHNHGEAEEYGIGTFVYFARRPFSLNKFDFYCAKHWPRSVIRCKGICYFKENPDMSYLFESAGRQMNLKEAGRWYATAPEEELEALLANEPGLKRDWDEEYGDRMQKLVFIGRDMDKSKIIADLNDCLA